MSPKFFSISFLDAFPNPFEDYIFSLILVNVTVAFIRALTPGEKLNP